MSDEHVCNIGTAHDTHKGRTGTGNGNTESGLIDM